MKEPVIFYKESGKPLEVVVVEIPDWDGFEKLIKFVQKYYSVQVLGQYDGPGARKWILESDGHKFELVHDDGYGNYFVARTEDSEEIVRKIGKDLEERFKKYQ